VEPVSLDAWTELPGQDISLTIYGAEVTHALEPIINGREDQLSPAIRARLSGPGPTAREYQQALADCERLRAEVARYFTTYDLLLCPMGVVPAHPHRVEQLDVDGELVPPRNALRAAVPFDLTGSPAISIPFGWSSEGLPIGVQIVGRHFDERSVLRAAAALETSKGEAMRPPL
jgi:aspartyl-tRNA(Asn)/glutamyl-tRNA(Gln) amidotransferase subunit A